ncbi:MAG TPA: hypothetical protein VJY15_12135 [Candidatus Acidoferrum sp.]|nr:hypothetical protein [Candidatus Acidoferrum sp.]
MIQREQRTMIRRLRTQAAKRKNALWLAAGILGAFLAAETSYRVRELLAAELIFGVGLILLSVLVAIFYMVAVACERGFDRTRRAYTALWVQHHRIFGTLKTITGKTFVAVSMWFGVLLFPMRLLPARIVPGNSLPGARGSSQETENRQVIPMGIHR